LGPVNSGFKPGESA